MNTTPEKVADARLTYNLTDIFRSIFNAKKRFLFFFWERDTSVPLFLPALIQAKLYPKDRLQDKIREWKGKDVNEIADDLQRFYGLEDFFKTIQNLAASYIRKRINLRELSITVFRRYRQDNIIGGRKTPAYLKDEAKKIIKANLKDNANAKTALSVAVLSSFLSSEKTLEILNEQPYPDQLVDLAADVAFNEWEEAYGKQWIFNDNVRDQIVKFLNAINPGSLVLATAYIIQQNAQNPEKLAEFIYSLTEMTVSDIERYQTVLEEAIAVLQTPDNVERQKLITHIKGKTASWRNRHDHDAIEEEGNLGKGDFLFNNEQPQKGPKILLAFNRLVGLVSYICKNFVPENQFSVDTNYMGAVVTVPGSQDQPKPFNR